VIRSDVGEAHRLSLSARVLSAVPTQVKAKPQREKHFCHSTDLRPRDLQSILKLRLLSFEGDDLRVPIDAFPSQRLDESRGKKSTRPALSPGSDDHFARIANLRRISRESLPASRDRIIPG
jgi:hypothetical protein